MTLSDLNRNLWVFRVAVGLFPKFLLRLPEVIYRGQEVKIDLIHLFMEK